MDEIPEDYRKPQDILGFPTRFSYDLSSNVSIKARCGRSSKSNILSGFELYDLRSPSEPIFFEEFERGIIMEPPPDFVGSGSEVQFSSGFEISNDILFEGEFSVILKNSEDQVSSPIYFIVRDMQKVARVGIMHPLYTWQAYNTENGGSFYWGKDFESGKISISLNRAMPANSSYHTIKSMMPFILALEKAEISFRSFSNHDLHYNPELIEDLDIVILTGHDEYWSHSIRESLEEFVKQGGNIASFAGNTGWWAIDVDGDDIYVDKSHQDDSTKSHAGTGQFKQPWINKPIQTLLGMSYQYAGYPVKRYPFETHALDRISKKDYDSSGDLIILEPGHPVFSGLNFENGSRWGEEDGVLGIEVDGVLLESDSVAHYRMEGVPMEIKVLAKSLVQCSGGMIDTDGNFSSGVSFQEVGVACESTPFPGGGNVVNFGSIGYYNSVSGPDSTGERIFINTITYLMGLESEEITDSNAIPENVKIIEMGLDRKSESVVVRTIGDEVLEIDSTQSESNFHTIISTDLPTEYLSAGRLVFDISWEIKEESPGINTKLLAIIDYLDVEGNRVSRSMHPVQSRLIGYQLSNRITEHVDESETITSARVLLYQNKEQKSKVLIYNFSISNMATKLLFKEKSD